MPGIEPDMGSRKVKTVFTMFPKCLVAIERHTVPDATRLSKDFHMRNSLKNESGDWTTDLRQFLDSLGDRDAVRDGSPRDRPDKAGGKDAPDDHGVVHLPEGDHFLGAFSGFADLMDRHGSPRVADLLEEIFGNRGGVWQVDALGNAHVNFDDFYS